MNNPSYDNHFVLCSDGMMFDLLDVLIYTDPIESTIEKIIQEHGEIVKASYSPLKIFDAISGVTKEGKFMPIGPTNWKNLFMIRGQFEFYLAYINWQGERTLIANSNEGVFWNFNVIDA